ncbi:uncharacterized protein ALTATR162_LOCUS11719 [Alternaria atra]|uniref:Transcription factor domain-containing protein n=1 Tax=Alternaria atra TaxID=119953 RepID=A0A8J2IBI9_9PLEO|nr:uncharacterized protein ALTATR162_LOCUS11719 [Alternaria atra]CAG5187441.1 unnamed protein product [Alternaria atra]
MSNPTGGDKGKKMAIEGGQGVQAKKEQSRYPEEFERRHSQTEIQFDYSSTTLSSTSVTPSRGIQQSPESPLQGRDSRISMDGIFVPRLLRCNSQKGTRYSQKPIPLTYDEALLFHHFIAHLGRWFDCTDASRNFMLRVPEKARQCPILCHAVLCFAGRHRREDKTSEAAYQRCITLLIDRLNEDSASCDDMLLSAVLILHFADQLNVPSRMGSCDRHHLAGTSSILRASQDTRFVDPSVPTFREAAFWVYVRQCLYNATISQQPLDIDFSLQLYPTPDSMQDLHPLAWLRLETAWSNQLLWNTAFVANFCFRGTGTQSELSELDSADVHDPAGLQYTNDDSLEVLQDVPPVSQTPFNYSWVRWEDPGLAGMAQPSRQFKTRAHGGGNTAYRWRKS